MSGRPKAGWRWRRRAAAAVLAAFLISLPLLILAPMVAGDLGFAIWTLMFIPALASVLLIQMPLKTVLLARGCSRRVAFASVAAANCALTYALMSLTSFPSLSVHLSISAVLGTIAAAIWTGLDDKALYGGQPYAQGNLDA